ncbi:hypothetical protein FS837_002431 [Tulasnella sp. UAMH 9824]|nr:hypothetical protein FS837_002431 [Tulasnella sp. UAMH 9824]
MSQCRYCPTVLADRRVRDAHENAIPATNMNTVSEMVPLIDNLQINPGGINPPATQYSYNVAPPVQFIHYSANSSGHADMGTSGHAINLATTSATPTPMGNLGGLNSSPTPNSHNAARSLRFVNISADNYAPGNMDT